MTTLSGVILMKALGTKACPGPCATTRATGSRYGDEHAASGQRRHAQNDRPIELECRILRHRDLVGFGLQALGGSGSAATL